MCFEFLVLKHVGSYLPDQGSNLHSLLWQVKYHWTAREIPLAVKGALGLFLPQVPSLYLTSCSYHRQDMNDLTLPLQL